MILVTGGAGFIGANFVLDWLSVSDEPVVNLDALTYAGNLENLASLKGDPRHIFLQGDICDRELVDRLFADEYPIQAVVNKQDLLDAISRVALVAERNAPIRMTFTGQEVALSAGSVDEAQANETLDIDMDGDDITVAFNPSYLKEGLSAVTEPFVRIKMTTPVKPVEFNGQQEADSGESMDYRYLLVPMRFNN